MSLQSGDTDHAWPELAAMLVIFAAGFTYARAISELLIKFFQFIDTRQREKDH